jgi:tRNA threonylcarbamoyladenosine biosynthesis protein TsaE
MTSTEAAFTLRSPEETRTLGRRLGACCRGGEVLLLEGPLGAGKTCLVQGLALGLGLPEEEPVCSPTFVLHCRYAGRLELNHVDAYRLEGSASPADLGLDESWGHPETVTAVEWPEMFRALDRGRGLLLRFTPAGAEARNLLAAALDAAHAALLERLRALDAAERGGEDAD